MAVMEAMNSRAVEDAVPVDGKLKSPMTNSLGVSTANPASNSNSSGRAVVTQQGASCIPILPFLQNLSTVVSAASKLAQLRCLWQTRDSEQVSATTWGLAIYTCAARILTTLMTTKDSTVLIRFVVMMALNIWVITTILEYRKAKKQD